MIGNIDEKVYSMVKISFSFSLIGDSKKISYALTGINF